MPCYDSRGVEDKMIVTERRVSVMNEQILDLKDKIKKMEKAEVEKEVEVCKIMSAMLSLMNVESSNADDYSQIFFDYESIERQFNVKKGLFKYHQKHRMEDQKFYIKTLKKMRKAETDKSIRTELKEEIKKAKAIDLNTDFRALVDRNYFSSKFLPAHK